MVKRWSNCYLDIDNTYYIRYYRVMTGKELVKLLEKNGFWVKSIRGSHHKMVNEQGLQTNVPVHGKKELGQGLLNKLLKEAGIKE
jgi:predicted RNA binding protein YcfA (HicA-like mRNA interferase family)